MSRPFDLPKKVRAREHALAALQKAGYSIVSPPTRIPVPASSGVKGSIYPDVQTKDDHDGLDNFYVMTSADAIPSYLINLVVAAAELDGVRVFIAVEESSEELEESCRACGAGLILVQDVEPRLILDPDPDVSRNRSKEYAEALALVRAKLVNRLELELEAVETQYSVSLTVTAEWEESEREIHLSGLRDTSMAWRQWSESMTIELERIATTENFSELDRLSEAVERGLS